MQNAYNQEEINNLRDKIIGLGEDSIRKSYYPKLRHHIHELERFRAILDQSKNMIILIDFATRKIIDINRVVCMMYKKDKEQILSINANDLLPKEITDEIDRIKQKKTEDHNYCFITELDIETANGQVPIEFILQKMIFEYSSYIRIVGANITERKKAKEKIHKLDFYDTLTELPNKKMLIKKIQEIRPTEKEYSAILLIDLDNFKSINEIKGHDIGDTILIKVKNRLNDILEKSYQLFRSGGDEFVLLINKIDIDLYNAIKSLENLALIIKKLINFPYYIKKEEFLISSSIGIEVFKAGKISEFDILKHVEIAMYAAKNNGRNTFCFYDPKMQEVIQEKIFLESDLKNALKKKQFSLYYQPQLDINEDIIGFEALIRWNHPTRGLVAPNEFIPLAEETGLIIEISKWVIKTACEQLKIFSSNKKTQDLGISINVSVLQFQDNSLVQTLSDILKQSNNPKGLILELTESIFIGNINEIIQQMRIIKKHGVSLSMDDFGTGYSCLSSLKKLPLHELKVDQSFVREVSTDPNGAVIVKTIIGMAKSLGLMVVAEGVETFEQLQYLKKHGCDLYQGYYFSKPLPIDRIYKLLHIDLPLPHK